MKKIFSIFCVAALLLCSVLIPVSAADFTITVGNVTGKVGDVVSVELNVTNNPGITGIQYSLTFDDTKFTLKQAIASDEEEPEIEAADSLAFASLSSGMPQAGAKSPITASHVSGTKTNKKNGLASIFKFEILSGVSAGKYPITLTVKEAYDTTDKDYPVVAVSGSITVEGSDPEPVAKTVTYTAANGTVFASLAPVTSFGEGAPVASGTIKTAGTDPEEAVYFYFFPNKGYTVEGMTIDGEPTIGSDISRKFTVTADKEFTFSFAKIADGATPALAAVTGATTVKEATQFATFGTATGASDFGIIIAKGDTLKDEAGLKAAFEKASETGAIRKYAAEDANAAGQFAIEVNGPLFAKGGTYIARMYAANGGNVTFGEIIDIAIAE